LDPLVFNQLKFEQQNDVLRQLYAKGFNYRQLHEIVGLSPSWIRRRLIGMHVRVRPRRPPRPLTVPVSQIVAEYNAGASIETLAERHDSYFKQIRQTLLTEGVQLRPSTKYPQRQAGR
jgi:hypothetical protein